MLPPRSMLTMKKHLFDLCPLATCTLSRCGLAIAVVYAGLVAGCTPPGPRALLDGKRLIERGKYSQAVEKLTSATALLTNNAQAWNYLGLACQYAGKPGEAERSYGRALALNHDLTEAHYNRACLWLAQNKPEKTEAAKTELLAYTLRRGNSAEGLLKLGLAQLRSRELTGAEKSFNDALRLSPQNPEGLNGLGLVRLQRGHPDEAARYFRTALKQQADYRPALLNLAIVSHQYLNDRSLALKEFRAYAALKPTPPDAQAVRAVALQIERDLQTPSKPVRAGSPAPPNTSNFVPREEKKSSRPGPPPTETPQPLPQNSSPLRDGGPAVAPGRYPYKSPAKPASGNRLEAQRLFNQGLEAQKAHRLADSVRAYGRATQLDPSFFEAHYNLGLAQADAGELPSALTAYENALALRPESLDARYNFALALKQANFILDAANELEKLLATYPQENRANLALGNLYAQQLRQRDKARQCYLRVLQYDPRNPQAGAIRSWLTTNPP
jgi:tetratricopeptide (TPR) repeat protein